ncbi:MAG: PAS domain S-box protein [Candidatus Thorarchaeota archaeon]
MSQILLVDDNEALLASSQIFLKKMNPSFEIFTSLSAQDALQKLAEIAFDAIVCDYQMPNMDGLELLTALRAQGNQIPFIMFTGKGREEVAMQALNLGADYYLMKSGDAKSLYGELAHIINRVITHRQTEEALQESERRYRAVVEDQTELIVRWQPDGTRTFVNEAFCRYHNQPPEALLGQSFFSGVPEEDLQAALEKVAQLTPENPAVITEHRFFKPDGTVVWQEWIDRAIFDGNNQLIELQSVGRDITDRKRAEEALRESEERYRSLVENMPIGMYRTTPGSKGKFLMVNTAMVSLLGYESEIELKGANVEDLYLDPNEREIYSNKILAQGSLVGEELRLRKKDGTPIWGSITSQIIYRENGEIAFFDGLFEDITERKRAEQALRESEERFRTIFQESADGIALVEIGETGHLGSFLEVNDAFCQLSGFSRTELNTMQPRDLLPLEEYRHLGKEGIAGTWLRDDAIDFEIVFLTRDGARKSVEVKSPKIALEDKQYRLLIAHDITERKKAEAALRESERKYLSIIENIPVVTWLSDSSGKTSYISPNVEQVYGFTPDEIYQMNEKAWFGRIHFSDLERVKKAYAGLFERVEPFDVEYRIQRKDGEWIWIQDRATAVYEEEGQLYAYGVFSDITSRKDLEEALRNQRDTAQRYLDIVEALIVEINREGLITVINKRGCDLLGYKEEELLGKNYFDVCLPAAIRERLRHIADKLLTGDFKLTEYYENPILTKHGEEKVIFWHNALLRNENNEISGILSSGIDITERKRAEQALQENEQRLNLALEAANLGLWDTDIRTGKVFRNERVAQIYGYSLEEMGTDIQWWESRIHPEDKTAVLENRNNHLKGLTPFYEAEYRFRRHSGEWRWILSRGKVVERDKDSHALRLVGILLDITERKQTEVESLESEKQNR